MYNLLPAALSHFISSFSLEPDVDRSTQRKGKEAGQQGSFHFVSVETLSQTPRPIIDTFVCIRVLPSEKCFCEEIQSFWVSLFDH